MLWIFLNGAECKSEGIHINWSLDIRGRKPTGDGEEDGRGVMEHNFHGTKLEILTEVKSIKNSLALKNGAGSV